MKDGLIDDCLETLATNIGNENLLSGGDLWGARERAPAL
jgi:hypothetical protein